MWMKIGKKAHVYTLRDNEKRQFKKSSVLLSAEIVYIVCMFFAYLINLPLQEAYIVPTNIIVIIGSIATFYFVIDFVKIYKANEKEQQRKKGLEE